MQMSMYINLRYINNEKNVCLNIHRVIIIIYIYTYIVSVKHEIERDTVHKSNIVIKKIHPSPYRPYGGSCPNTVTVDSEG